MSSRARGRRLGKNGEEPDYEQKRDEERLTRGLQNAMGESSTQVRTDFLDDLVEPDIEDANRRDIIANLLAKDYPLANFSGDERIEKKWTLRIMWELFRIVHPNEEFALTEDDQKWAYDDPDAGLAPLTDVELLENFIAFDVADSRVSRGKGMKQQETIIKTISEARTQRIEHDRGDSGLLDRVRSWT